MINQDQYKNKNKNHKNHKYAGIEKKILHT